MTPCSGVQQPRNLSRRFARALWTGLCGAVFLFLLLPTVVVIPASFSAAKYFSFPPATWSVRWYVAYFHDEDWLAATSFSLEIALLSTVVALVLGVLVSLALVRSELPGKAAIRAIVLAPMIVPHIVIAVAMYLVYMRWDLVGTLPGLVLAHTVVCVPLVVINLSTGLQKMDPSLEMAAASMGADRIAAFRWVTLPLLAPSLATAAAFSFITSLDEAVISYFLSGSQGKTLTRKMFEDIDFDLSPIIAVASTLIIVVSVALMGSIELLRARNARLAAREA